MNPFERWSVRLGSLAVAVTGFALLWFKYALEPADPFSVVSSPWQIVALKSHVLVAPFFVLAIGFIAVRHVWRHFVRGVVPGRRSGLLTAAMIAPMIASGYLIQVVVSQGWRTAMIATHIASSVLFTVGVALHLGFMWRYVRRAADETFFPEIRTEKRPGSVANAAPGGVEGAERDRSKLSGYGR